MLLGLEAVRTRTVGHLILRRQRTDPTPHTDLIRWAISEILTDESNEVYLKSMNLCE